MSKIFIVLLIALIGLGIVYAIPMLNAYWLEKRKRRSQADYVDDLEDWNEWR